MKKNIKKIISIFTRLFFFFYKSKFNLKGSTLFNIKFKITSGNYLNLISTCVEKSTFRIEGKENSININDALVTDSHISIQGTKNLVECEEGVKLRKGNIQLRGSKCHIIIKKGTTFGQVRIVNVGVENKVVIGENCLFADNIEIWASDTHSIYNNHGELINKEKSVLIHDHVWVGSHVIIMKGVTIHNDCVIGMGSLVTKSVLANTISGGIPNKTLKEDITWDENYTIE